jgi:hypothetical protein
LAVWAENAFIKKKNNNTIAFNNRHLCRKLVKITEKHDNDIGPSTTRVLATGLPDFS